MKYLIILTAFILLSCKTNCVTKYKLTFDKRNYYTNFYEIENDTIFFFEPKRDGVTPHFYFKTPLNNTVILKTK